MWRILQIDEPEDFVIATGETHSLEEFCSVAFSECKLDWREHVDIDQSLFRPSEIMTGKGNPTKAYLKSGCDHLTSSKTETSMKQNILYVGLDVDDTQYHGSAFNKDTGGSTPFLRRLS
jgi:GDP-D-mannose dehydratase